MTSRLRKKIPKCYHCGKMGHTKQNCRFFFLKTKRSQDFHCHEKERAHKAAVSDYSTSDESDALVTCHVFAVSTITDEWIVDSGATCQMCKDSKLFDKFETLKEPLEVSLGDGHKLKAMGIGNVSLKMKLSDGKSRSCSKVIL